jgi:hypothetical protein
VPGSPLPRPVADGVARAVSPGARTPGRGATVGGVLRGVCALVVGGVLSGFAILLVTGQYINDGPVVATVSRGHGVHAGDVFVAVGWAVAMLALFLLVRPRQRRVAFPRSTGR